PCGEGAGRRFLIIPAGFGCEVGIDAWVGGWRWGVDMRLVGCNYSTDPATAARTGGMVAANLIVQ
ncbi:MAG: hypothetical protein MIO93_08215, partial [ANME-2 cluster archaeon]|nr:hypothetical protein [ANME-2 cluster archaeon]